jgi:outer membrane immunogenic protein
VPARFDADDSVPVTDAGHASGIRAPRRIPGRRLGSASTCAGAALLALWAAGTPARGADAPVMPVKAVPAAIVNTWNGLYFGAHGGFGWGGKKFVDNFPVFDGEIDADTYAQGALGGFQIGHNHAFGGLVLGIESDFSWSDVHNSNFPCFTFGDQLCTAKAEWFATLAGRIGFANGPAMLYLKGGGAVVRDHFSNIATCAGNQPIVSGGITAACGDLFTAHQFRFGWIAGAGFERFFARNWSFKFEFNHMDFGARSVPFDDGGGGFFTEEIHQRINVVKVGINYHFDWGAPAKTALDARGDASMAATDTVQETFRMMGFAGVDIAKRSYAAWTGALVALSGDLETSGPRMLIVGQGSTYSYGSNGGSIRGIETGGTVLLGRGIEGDNYSVNVLLGGNAANHMLSAFDPTNSVRGTAFGVKARADAWVNPTPRTMAYGEAEYSTAFRTYGAGAKLGVDVTADRQVFVGPAVAAYGDRHSRQWRVGAHVTQLKIGRIQIDLSGGYQHDSTVGDGAYGVTELSANF